MLHVRFTHRTLRLARRGRLLPWLGPALRGLTGGRLKAFACRHSVADQLARWRYCAGCPLQAGCQYGETLEPDPDPGVHMPAGQDQAARPIVFAPQFPLPAFAEAGFAFDVAIVFVGPAAASHADDVWEAVRVGGADLGLGLGEDHIPFDVLPSPVPDASEAVELPLQPTPAPPVRRVVVDLTSPLFLARTNGDGRRPLLQPTFADLLRVGCGRSVRCTSCTASRSRTTCSVA